MLKAIDTDVRAPVQAAHAERPTVPRIRPPLLLGVFFASLYLLTMSGHLDSPDEELIFLTTRGLVERGSLDIGNATSPERLAFPGVDGRTYAPYGPVSSMISAPFYVLGEGLSKLAPPRYTDYLERFAVGLRDPLVSMALCLVFYAVARVLRFARRDATLLTLAFGVATLIWPYAKYSWSEPVTALSLLASVYAAVRAVRSSRLAWSALCGVAIALAIGSKIATAVAIPGLLLYLAWHRKTLALPFAGVLLVPALGIAALDVARFGNPFDTGYHLDGLIDLSHPIGIAGLLLSPGKSVFLYAPVALLGLVGLRKLPKGEAALFAFIVLSHIVLYGTLAIWSGDAAWGPRYLVPVVALLVLPAGAVLRQYARVFVALVIVGVVINLGGVLLDQRVYYVDLLGTAERNPARVEILRWDPRMTPVVVHWRLLAKRYYTLVSDLRQSTRASLDSGTYESEGGLSDGFPAWTSGDAVLDVVNRGQPVQIALRYRDVRPSALGDANVDILVDGVPVPSAVITRSPANVQDADNARVWDLSGDLTQFATQHDRISVDVRSNTFVPARDAPSSNDIRELGVDIVSLTFTTNGQTLVPTMAQFPPMPITDARPWSFELLNWFWGTSTHLADIWAWYLWLSGLPRWLVLFALPPLFGIVWSLHRLQQNA